MSQFHNTWYFLPAAFIGNSRDPTQLTCSRAGREKQHSNFVISGVLETQPSQNIGEMDIPLQPIGKDIILGKVVIEKIILISNKKIPKDAIKYLQVDKTITIFWEEEQHVFKIHLEKVPNRAITETSSGRIPPLFTEDSEVCFPVPADDKDIFLLHFRPDVPDEVEQFEIHLQIKTKGKTKTAGTFGICYADLQRDRFSEKIKTRHLKSQLKSIAEIEIKYKVDDFSSPAPAPPPPPAPPETAETAASHPPNQVLAGPDLPPDTLDDTFPASPDFRPNSCIVVLGTTGRGKTTTMNLYTGNNAATKAASHGTTTTNSIYPDLHHSHYPVWLDTVGLDEADAETNNSDLVRSYLLKLQSARVRWVHAVIWCITPEDKKLQYLKDQAKVIRSFGNNSTRIWGNVIIIAKQGNTVNQQSFQVRGDDVVRDNKMTDF